MEIFALSNISLLFVLNLINPVFSFHEVSNNLVSQTFKLLDEGEEKIILLEDIRNITLIIGNTGAGKSTLVQWLAGSTTDLVSKEVREGTGEYIIEDGNFRIGSSIDSKTLYPELVVENSSKNAYYDCPGFSSTRSSSEDIASNFFNKKVADHAKYVKILLVTGYPSVRKGVDRMNFMKLLRHATQMIKHLDKFQNSIAIAVTKVDNIYVKKGKSFYIVSDENVINTIADYFQSVIEELKKKLLDSSNFIEEKTFCETAIKLLNFLMLKHNGTFSRIGIFRRPEVPGPLSESEILEKGKENLRKIISKNIKFIAKNENDFGYSVSEESINDIKNLIHTLNEHAWIKSMEFESELISHYSTLSKKIRNKVNSFLNEKVVEANLTEAYLYFSKLSKGYEVLAEFVDSNTNKSLDNFEQLGLTIKNISGGMGLHSMDSDINQLLGVAKYFSFFQLVSRETLNTRNFLQVFLNTKIQFKYFRDEVMRDVTTVIQCINSTLTFNINQETKTIKSHYEKQDTVIEVEQTISKLKEGVSILTELLTDMENVTNAKQVSQLIFNHKLVTDIPSIQGWAASMFHLGGYMDYLVALSNNKKQLTPLTLPFMQAKNYLFSEQCWYEFLENLYELFSKWEFQCCRNAYNVANIEMWGREGSRKGIQIHKQNIQGFLERIENYNILNIQAVKYVEKDEKKLRELNEVLNEVLVSNPVSSCGSNGELYVHGYYVKLSDIVDDDGSINHFCKNGISSLVIFASNTIFINANIKAMGLELQIVIAAPIWHVISYCMIDLDGKTGVSISPQKATNGWSSGQSGHDGKPGGHGGHAGHFLGIADTIINGNNLNIYANGGNGGNGQDGGDGKRGNDGNPASNYSYREFIKKHFIPAILNNEDKIEYRYHGSPGQNGGAGGDGGAGGLGGLGGKIQILSFQSWDLPILNNANGFKGSNGQGGLGKEGGRPGDDMRAFECYHVTWFYIPKEGFCGDTEMLESSSKGGYAGSNGYSGLIGRHSVNDSPKSAGVNSKNIVYRYKEFLYTKLGGRYSTHALSNHLQKLNETPELIRERLKSLYNVNELHALERKTFLGSNNMNRYETHFCKSRIIFDSSDLICLGTNSSRTIKDTPN